MQARKPKQQVDQSVPRYRVLEKCYINDTFLDPDAQPIDPETEEPRPLYVAFDGIPGPHLEPANDAALAMAERHSERMQDTVSPIDTLTKVG